MAKVLRFPYKPNDYEGNEREFVIEAANEWGEIDEEMLRIAPGLHFCPAWDGMAIADGCPEMDTCTCDRRRQQKAPPGIAGRG